MTEIKELLALINNSELTADQKKELLAAGKKVERRIRKYEFMVQRTIKDKTIATNVLNATIQELADQKKVVEEQSEQLRIHLTALENSYKELEQFSYIASHDLKSPLRTISNFAQLLQRRYKNKIDHEANEYIDFIVTGVKQMHMVISDLLEYARVGDRGTPPIKVHLEDVINLVEINLRDIIREHDAEIIIQNPLPTLFIRKSSILQLFQNLISNSIKFRSEATPRITISCQQQTNYIWEFSLKDNGVGMDESYQHKAFLPFQRLNNQDRQGTGIGLAICEKAVKLHGGHIKYISPKNQQGTTFVFTLSQTPTLEKVANTSN